MALFDGMKEKKAQREREEAERQTADKAAREEYKQKIMQSQLVQDILGSIDMAKDDPENSWICLATDYYDHDPREVSVDKNGDGIKIQRIHYYDEVEVFQIPMSNGGYTERQVKIHKCEVVQQLGYGFVKSDYKPIDTPRTITTSAGQQITFKTDEIKTLVEEIVYGRLQQLFPQCEFKGRITNKLGSEDSVGPKLEHTHDLTYFVPGRVYKDWY